MPEPLTPSVGLVVLHLFCVTTPDTDRKAIETAVESAVASDIQVVPVAILGHKADVAFMVLGKDMWAVRKVQTDLVDAGLLLADSYLSLTETSEYSPNQSETRLQHRLYPQLPPADKAAWCFYPMTKRRDEKNNWYALSYDDRKTLMDDHGSKARKFGGRVVQLVTGSTGIDDWEWGVTLFAERPDDLKEIVYTLRYDEASTLYGEFGQFFTGAVGTLAEVLDSAGVHA